MHSFLHSDTELNFESKRNHADISCYIFFTSSSSFPYASAVGVSGNNLYPPRPLPNSSFFLRLSSLLPILCFVSIQVARGRPLILFPAGFDTKTFLGIIFTCPYHFNCVLPKCPINVSSSNHIFIPFSNHSRFVSNFSKKRHSYGSYSTFYLCYHMPASRTMYE